MLNNKGNVMIIDNSTLLLESMYQDFSAVLVDYTRYDICGFVYFNECLLSEELAILEKGMATDAVQKKRTGSFCFVCCVDV